MEIKLAEVEEEIIDGNYRGGCKNNLGGGEKALNILQRTQYALY